MWHLGLQPIIIWSNDDPRMTLTYFMARSILETETFTWEKVKTLDFFKTIAAWDLKSGRCRQKNIHFVQWLYLLTLRWVTVAPGLLVWQFFMGAKSFIGTQEMHVILKHWGVHTTLIISPLLLILDNWTWFHHMVSNANYLISIFIIFYENMKNGRKIFKNP